MVTQIAAPVEIDRDLYGTGVKVVGGYGTDAEADGLVQVLLTSMLIRVMLPSDAETVEHSTEWRLTRKSDALPQPWEQVTQLAKVDCGWKVVDNVSRPWQDRREEGKSRMGEQQQQRTTAVSRQRADSFLPGTRGNAMRAHRCNRCRETLTGK